MDQAELNKLADELESMQSSLNEGRGVQTAKYIIFELKTGKLNLAKLECFNNSDKLSSYPELKTWIIQNLFSGDPNHPWKLFG